MKKNYAVMVKDTPYKAYQWSSKETLEQAIAEAERFKDWKGVTKVYVRDKNLKKVVYTAK